ncbi:glycosyl hydrolase family 28-related protein [Corynebacterium callunae]|uniref:glycosyl hydrolase family 28-related protein n=1 Tax=Corynebacterium callunae TaxID=1721 RepID=UPI003982BAE7
MTTVKIDIKTMGATTHPDDRVVMHAPEVRARIGGGLVSTAPLEVPLVDGVATLENVEPGPMLIRFECLGIADTMEKLGIVPDSGVWTLDEIISGKLTWTPPVVSEGLQKIIDQMNLALDSVGSAVEGEMGGLIRSAESAAQTSAMYSETSAIFSNSANVRATIAETAASNAVARVDALEAVSGLGPSTPVDGQTASLVLQSDSLTRSALDGAVTAHTGMYPVESYGAVGDGVADDTVAIQAAIDAATSAGGGTIFFRPGAMYLVKTLNVSEGITLSGYGSKLLRPANTPNWVRTITNQNRAYVGPKDSEKMIIIRGLTVDGNLANQGAYENYELQQSMLLQFQGDPTQPGRVRVLLEDVTTNNCVSDGVHVWRNVDITIRNHRANDCFRGGLVASGGHSIIRVEGYRGGGTIRGAHIDIEIDSAGYGGSLRTDIYLTDAVELTRAKFTDNFDGKAGAIIRLDRCVLLSGVVWVLGSEEKGFADLQVKNSTLHTYATLYGNSIINPQGAIFENVKLYGHHVDGATERRVINIRPNNLGKSPTKSSIKFINCDLMVAEPGGSSQWIGYAREAADNLSHTMEIIGGNITTAFRGVQLPSGHAVIGGGVKIDAPTPIFVNNDGARPQYTVLGDIKFGATATQEFFTYGSGAQSTIEHSGTVVDVAVNNSIGTQTGWGGQIYRGRRTLLVDAPPTATTTGIRGDIARLKTPVAGAAYEWICTTSGSTNAAWKVLTTIPT